MRGLVLLILLATAGCGADETIDRDTGGGGSGGTGTGGAGQGGACQGRDYCGCATDPACRVIGEECFCPCNAFPCSESCVCACGDGVYLGCAELRCTIADCPKGSTLEMGPDGCPFCVPPPN